MLAIKHKLIVDLKNISLQDEELAYNHVRTLILKSLRDQFPACDLHYSTLLAQSIASALFFNEPEELGRPN